MKTESIEIVDLGRGAQLRAKRITVQDVLPFYREGASNEEIRQWIPSLTDEEMAALFAYIGEHFEEVVEAEKQIKEHHDRMRGAQPAWTHANDHLSIEDRRTLLRDKLDRRQAETNGADDPAG